MEENNRRVEKCGSCGCVFGEWIGRNYYFGEEPNDDGTKDGMFLGKYRYQVAVKDGEDTPVKVKCACGNRVDLRP